MFNGSGTPSLATLPAGSNPFNTGLAPFAGSSANFAAGSIPLNTGLAPSAVPSANFPVNPFALLPDNGGGVPVNNSIPNAATTLSSRAGLNGLSPFLPTYYLNYTQVGPFYTGSDSPTLPRSESPSLHPIDSTNSVQNDADGESLIAPEHRA